MPIEQDARRGPSRRGGSRRGRARAARCCGRRCPPGCGSGPCSTCATRAGTAAPGRSSSCRRGGRTRGPATPGRRSRPRRRRATRARSRRRRGGRRSGRRTRSVRAARRAMPGRRRGVQRVLHQGGGRGVGRLVDVEVGLEAVAGGEQTAPRDVAVARRRRRPAHACRRGASSSRSSTSNPAVRIVRGQALEHDRQSYRRPNRLRRCAGALASGSCSDHCCTGASLAAVRAAVRRSSAPTAGERPETPPVWFMRQAGRSLPEYRELRVGTAMLDACLDPGARRARSRCSPCAATASTPRSSSATSSCRSSWPASTSRSCPGGGRCSRSPIRTAADVAGARRPARIRTRSRPSGGGRATVAQLGATPLIGFAGAPFTLASYLVEGGPSKDQLRARTLMHADPDALGGAR